MNRTEIPNLELRLLLEEVRSSADRISELLADGCIEYCSSGRIYRYTRGDTFAHGRARNWEIVDFEAKELATGIVLATYRLLKHDEADDEMRVSLRSSIWKLAAGRWQMIFHQGTPCTS